MVLSVLVVAMTPLVSCGREEPLNEPRERYEMVDVDYARAVRLSVAEVTGGKLVALDLKNPTSVEPVWESQVADEDGQLTQVRVEATRGKVLGTSAGPTRTDAERQDLLRLLEEATLLPGQAAREVADTETGEVVQAIGLDRRDGVPVWKVSALGVADEQATVHVVDARTGDVLERHDA